MQSVELKFNNFDCMNLIACFFDIDRYWEAITRWDEAISLTPNNEKLYEMKSQV